MSALAMGASFLASIKRPARMAIFWGAGFSFSCAEPENSAEIKIDSANVAAVTNLWRTRASLAGRKSSTGIWSCRKGGDRQRKGQPVSRPVGRCALATARKCLLNRARGCRTRATQRAPREVFHRGNAATSQVHDGMIALRHARDRNFPTLLQHIQTDDDASDGRESQSEQRKSREQFAHEIELQSCEHSQEPPHPFSSVVRGLHSVLCRQPHLSHPYNPLRCTKLSLRSTPCLPVRLGTRGSSKSDGTQGTFLIRNHCPSTALSIVS